MATSTRSPDTTTFAHPLIYNLAQAKRALGDLPGALADAEAARAEEPSNRIVVDLVYDLEDERDALRAAAGGGRAAAKQAGQGQAERQQADTEERREEAGEAEVAFAMGGAAGAGCAHSQLPQTSIKCRISQTDPTRDALRARRSLKRTRLALTV